ncbi:MAG: exodeoxyribonuclease I [Oceanospirillales bacterium]|nr:MAG: exodeoxyribonuclease I [Oceanospirillales bacterium]
MTQEPTFYWHDYETSGTDPKRDRPMQFAGVRTDMNFNVIGEPLVLYCAPADDFLPNPMASLITGITPQKALQEGVCEAEFIQRIHAELSKPGTCAVGYNSLRFDDEITRYTLYRNFHDPYAREWQNGCSRWDIIDMVRLTRTLRPKGIKWPNYDTGAPSLRLEDLTKANGLSHDQAHDALSDVWATIALAKMIKEKQPSLFNYVFKNRGKQAVREMLDTQTMKPVLHISSRYPAELGNMAVAAPIAEHPVNRNAVIVWDLRHDPAPLMDLSVEEIKTLLYTHHKELPKDAPKVPLKLVHINRCPVLAPAKMLSPGETKRWKIVGDQCRVHLASLRQTRDSWLPKLNTLYAENDLPMDKNPDHMLYSGGFFSDSDRHLMEEVRQTPPELLQGLNPPFQDPRLPELLLRYKARNFSYVLTEEEQQQWEEYRSRQLLGPDNDGCLTITQMFDELNRIATEKELSPTEQHILEELALYAESIYPMEF